MVIGEFNFYNITYIMEEFDNNIGIKKLHDNDYSLVLNIYELKYVLFLTKRNYKKYEWLEKYMYELRAIRTVYLNVLSRKFNSVAKAFTLANKRVVAYIQ